MTHVCVFVDKKDRILITFLSEAVSGPQVFSRPMCLILLSRGQNSDHLSLRGCFWAPGVFKTHVFVSVVKRTEFSLRGCFWTPSAFKSHVFLFVVKRTEFCPCFSPRLFLGPRYFQYPCICFCCQKDRILPTFLSEAVSGPQVFS